MAKRNKEKQFVVHSGHHRSMGLMWVEHYYFTKLDNTYYLHWGVGWSGGYHNDGSSSTDELPREWFRRDWNFFLHKLTTRYPESSYGYGVRDLENMDGLKEFFGFK